MSSIVFRYNLCYTALVSEKEFLDFIQGVSRRTGFEQTGDDAAIVAGQVISTDQFLEGTHFTWKQMTPEQIGYKAAVQALSDLAAMASPPLALLCSAAWPRGTQERMRAVFLGLEQACLEYGVPLVGGDITSSQALTYLDITVIGRDENSPRKKGARPSDLVAVSGPLGSARGGLYCLDHGIASPKLVDAFQKPRAHIETARTLNRSGFITALTDTSDGLSKSLHEIARHSQVGFEIQAARLPVARALKELCAERGLDLKDYVFHGGEDYQILMTLKPETSEKLISDLGLTVIGRVVSALQITVDFGNEKQKIPEGGWDPFIL